MRRQPTGLQRQVLPLNRLIQHPERITCPVLEDEPPPGEEAAPGLDELLHRPPVDEVQTRDLAWPVGGLLNAIGPEEYETLRLRRLFQDGTHGRTEQELLHQSVRRIAVSNGTVTVLLKNNQTLEGDITHERYRAQCHRHPSQSETPRNDKAPPAGGRLLPGVYGQRGAALQL